MFWLIDSDAKFYLPHVSDFRGRIYPVSLISPVFNKLLRPVLKVGEHALSSSSDLKHEVLDSPYYLAMRETGLFSDYDSYIKSMILQELGKVNKNKMVS